MKYIFKIFFRIIQLAALIFFGYWLYLKFFGAPLEFAIFTITMLPFLIGGLVVGTLTSCVFLLLGTVQKSKFIKIYNIVLFILYIAAITYLIVLIHCNGGRAL